MRVTLEHTADTGLAGAVLVIGAGSADDGAERSGLAHLTEHLAFDAHASGSAPLWQRFETLGAGAYNGMTSWDSTTYFTFVPQENLPDLLSTFPEYRRACSRSKCLSRRAAIQKEPPRLRSCILFSS
jgi:predicted Zn-dependent peptidase